METTPAHNGADRDWLTITEIAEHTGTTVTHIRKLVARREIPFTKLGRLLRFHRPTIDKMLADKTVPVGGR